MRILTETTTEGIERWLELHPSYDHRSETPNSGCHNVEMTFGIRRGRVVVTWRLIHTDWYHKELREDLDKQGTRRDLPDGFGSIDYHSPVKQYKWQTAVKDCQYTGGDCYCDDSGLASRVLFNQACRDPAQIWITLEEWLQKHEQKVEAGPEGPQQEGNKQS